MRQANEKKIYTLFFEYPERKFTVREIEQMTKIPKASVQRYLKEMKKEEIVTLDNSANITLLYKTLKINNFLRRLVESGLIEELITNYNPSCIILFGSIRKGESVKESDIDIFIESSIDKKRGWEKFEKKLGHPIDLFVKSNVNKLEKELFNNVINGIKLYGSLNIR